MQIILNDLPENENSVYATDDKQERMIVIGGRQLEINDFQKILLGREQVSLDMESLENVQENFDFLKAFVKDKIIYGINTGLGPMSQYKVEDKDREALQYNLIRSHAAGSGSKLPDNFIRFILTARLNTLMRGYSGIHPEVTILLSELINKDILPLIPQHGGVGASGDLVQLAHLALTLIGEGKVTFRGEEKPTADIFKLHGLKPFRIRIREALALINGTSVMSGIGVCNVIRARQLLNWAVAASALLNEIVETYDDHYSLELNRVKLHAGQASITAKLQYILSDSRLVRKREDDLFYGINGDKIFTRKIQEYYSIRCITQILGPVEDTINNSEKIVLDEINSVNDNPIIDHKSKNVYHGGNFHGDYVSLEMDKLKIAVTRLSMLMERQMNFLMNDKLNNILPPFVNLGVLGLNLGLQGVQFTATSTVAENQTLSNPMYVHSIPTNNDNQDIVSMGTNAALLTHKVIKNTFEVAAIQMLAVIQAVDYLGYKDKLSSFSRGVYDALRKEVPVFTDDDVRYPDIEKIKDYLFDNELIIKTPDNL